jgi:molybdopterin converting factor small subunit
MTAPIKVHVPGELRQRIENHDSLEITAASVGEALAAIGARYPAFAQRLFQADGRLNRFVNVYLNDEDIRFLSNLDTPLRAGDELSIVPAIAGG